MSVRDTAAKLIREGSPLIEVAEKLGKTHRRAELKRLLLMSVGEGRLFLSQIYFSIPEKNRRLYESVYAEKPEMKANEFLGETVKRLCRNSTRGRYQGLLDANDFRIEYEMYWLSKDSPYSDTYRFLRELETTLYRSIRKTLDLRYFPPEIAWWDKGVPAKIIEHCEDSQRRNLKDDLGPWCYMNFIHFKEIINSHWDEFCKVLPSEAVHKGKKRLLSALQRANEIRNGVMHPLKGIQLSEKDCKDIRDLNAQLRWAEWREPIGPRCSET